MILFKINYTHERENDGKCPDYESLNPTPMLTKARGITGKIQNR